MQIRAGTSGYSYKEWRGSFYPEDLKPDDWLSYYASQLNAVEINNTFYRMPKTHVVAAWRDAVPSSFRFVLKASRRITHQGRLKNVEEATGYLLKRADTLGERLGALLFQLPPNMRADTDRLAAFQALLPAGLPVAFEFRHPSWDSAEVNALLAEHQHARVVSHEDDTPPPVLSGNLIYLRLRGEHYNTRELQQWLRALHRAKPSNALVFFKHEDAGAGPALARQFLDVEDKLRQKPTPKRAQAKARTRKVEKKTR